MDSKRMLDGDSTPLHPLAHELSGTTRYCQSADKTVKHWIDTQTGQATDQSLLIEVPHDQYDESLGLVQKAITEGKLSSLAGDDSAVSIVKKGDFTYRQVRNVADGDKVESLSYSQTDEAVVSNSPYAISFALQFARGKWDRQSDEDALRGALMSALNSGKTSLIAGIIASHSVRAKITAAGAVALRVNMNRIASSHAGRSVMHKLATVSLGRAASGTGTGLLGHVTRLFRSNVVSAILLTLSISAPDAYHAAISKRMSWGQAFKNFATNSSGVAGGVLGWFGGSALGALAGNYLTPGAGIPVWSAVGALLVCIVAGFVAAAWVHSILDGFIIDDSKQMLEVVNEATHELVSDYLLTESECEDFAKQVKVKLSKLRGKWLREMHRVGVIGKSNEKRIEFAYDCFQPLCKEIVSKREKVCLPDKQQIRLEIEKAAAMTIENEIETAAVEKQ